MPRGLLRAMVTFCSPFLSKIILESTGTFVPCSVIKTKKINGKMLYLSGNYLFYNLICDEKPANRYKKIIAVLVR